MAARFRQGACQKDAERPPTGPGRGAALLLVGFVAGCTTDHDALAARPPADLPDDASGGGAAPAVSREEAGQSGAMGVDSQDASEQHARRTLSVVHGVTDARGPIALCFSPIDDGQGGSMTAIPFPPGGLEYGRSVSLEALEGIDFDADGVASHVLAGDLSLVEGLDCASALERARLLSAPAPVPDAGVGMDAGNIDASIGDMGGDASVDAVVGDGSSDAGPEAESPEPPPLRVRRLPDLPPGTLGPTRSYVLVLGGCMGGPAFTDPSERSVCGEFYSPLVPSLTPFFVAASRVVEPGRIGLQFLNATPAVTSADIRSVPGESSSAGRLLVARDVVSGEIAPSVPERERSVGGLGILTGGAELEVLIGRSSTPAYSEPWQKTLDAAGREEVLDGESYTLILVGPHPGFAANRWWNGAVVTIVANDPI